MLLVAAILLSLYVVDDRGWQLVLVITAACVEVSQTLFWLWYSKRGRVQVGREALIGARAEVVSECRPNGSVRLHGELWQARCEAGAETGAAVHVRAIDGLTLEVEPERSLGAPS